MMIVKIVNEKVTIFIGGLVGKNYEHVFLI